MALYRFLFAPVLLAVAVLTTAPRRAQHPPAPPPPAAPAVQAAPAPPAVAPPRDARVAPSHPGSGR